MKIIRRYCWKESVRLRWFKLSKEVVLIINITDLLSYTLGDYFPGINVYTEQVGEGFCRPAFFIWQNGQRDEKELGNRYFRLYDITISYFPTDQINEDVYEDLWGIGDELTVFLRLIEHDGQLCHGRGMNMEIKDGVLQFSVSYGQQLELVEQEIKMQKLNMNGVID